MEWPDIGIKNGRATAPITSIDQPLPPEVEERLRQRRALVESIEGRIAPVKVSLLYRLGLLVVAFTMILLPVVYFAMIGAVAFGVFYYATHATALLEGSGARGRLAVYAAPIIAGGLLVLTMLKPIFAKRIDQPPCKTLLPSEQRLLFNFVERICKAIHAPMPSRIDVNCDVNASASFRGGWFSLVSNDLVLTIGLPLVAGLTLRQFAGILAHEFGHFAQGTAMRLLYIIAAINSWFARVVYDRDSVDQMLSALDSGSVYSAILLAFVRLFIFITRGILWCLMMFGHVISCFMMRQMEFDADRYEARLAGSDAFAATSLKAQMLGLAAGGAYADLQNSLTSKKLADDLPALILAHYETVPLEVKRKVAGAILERKTGLFDTHPSDKERIASAKKEAAPGLFTTDRPAREIINGFEDLSRKVTLAHYQMVLGPLVRPDFVMPTQQFISERSAIPQYKLAMQENNAQ